MATPLKEKPLSLYIYIYIYISASILHFHIKFKFTKNYIFNCLCFLLWRPQRGYFTRVSILAICFWEIFGICGKSNLALIDGDSSYHCQFYEKCIFDHLFLVSWWLKISHSVVNSWEFFKNPVASIHPAFNS